MPTYEYQCQACDHTFDEFQSITAKPLRKCPECGKPKLKRLIGTGAGIIFKGSGFYETDYRSDSYHKAAKADKESAKPASDTSSKADASTTKPEAKPEPKPKTESAKPAKKSADKNKPA
ncbi:MAG: zinc ribbon domain-containing protein [Phycisphaera sp.]|nr:zinc ribbon domain-containing protein [Phycisphaera sp.]